MSERQSFTGFPQEGLQFLADLGENNERDWFNSRKQVYLDTIVAPAVAFVETVGEQLQFISPHIQYDTRTNGQGSLMRIYRDTRFSADKTPYKTWVGIRFWEGPGKANENPGFFFGFDATAGGLHVGMHGFDKTMLTAYREAVADDKLGQELEAALEAVRRTGAYEVNGEHYKRVPRGFDPSHPRADLLRYNTLYASSPGIEPAVLSSAGLVDVVIDHCENMAPVQRWLVKLKKRAKT
jgi:uncharacterized protein (TIGR02453 family)